MAKKDTTRKKPDRRASTKDSIEISKVGDGSTIAAGRGAKATSVAINFFGGKWQLPISILGIFLAVGGYVLWRELFPPIMTGPFVHVAVADFAVVGNSGRTSSTTELSNAVYEKLQVSLKQIDEDHKVDIWSPDQVGKVNGKTPEERARSAEKIANKIRADILVYGLIDTSQRIWTITPEFYVRSDNFFEAEEVTGHYQTGEPLELTGQEDITRRLELVDKYNFSAQVLARITLGLAYFSLRKYEKALDIFQAAQQISEGDDSKQDLQGIAGWTDDQQRKIVYLLAGNAATKANDYDTAINELSNSLAVDPDYPRPMITLGSVYYLQALEPFERTKQYSDIDLELLGKAFDKYSQALSQASKPAYQPGLSDILTKAHFGLGQCYLMQSLADREKSLSPAVNEFSIVIADYGDGKNARIRELAAESHARLGLIYVISGNPIAAAQEYETAADLLFDNPERQLLYQERAQQMLAKTPIATP